MLVNESKPTVTLRGGPFDGQTVPAPSDGAALVLFEGEPEPGAECVRYRPSRERGVYTYRGKDRLVGTLPAPGVAK